MHEDGSRAAATARAPGWRSAVASAPAAPSGRRLEAALEAAAAMATVQTWRLACLVAALDRLADADRHELALRVVEQSRQPAQVARAPAVVAVEICERLARDIADGTVARGGTVASIR